MARIANFIDAGYLSQLLTKTFDRQKIDYAALAQAMASDREVLRTFIYDCMPYRSQSPSTEEIERYKKKEKFLTALEHQPRLEVRLGRLEPRGEDKNGELLFDQKRVDVMKGVDLALLASKHRIDDAAILTGDSDFVPAIEVAKAEGVVVHLFHGPRTRNGPQPHRELIQCCDDRIEIDQEFVNSIRL